MPKVKKESARFLCPDCGSEKVLAREELLWDINTGDFYCASVKTHDDYAKTKCQDCGWEGFKKDLIDKTEEIEAAEKLKADKEYQRYLKLKDKFEKENEV